jgi:DNA topoisomerase III
VYFETVINLKVDSEYFVAKGQRMHERNFLDVFAVNAFNDSFLPKFSKDDKIKITKLKMDESSTRPPSLLSESALITAMDKNGIGTDATIHEHIK